MRQPRSSSGHGAIAGAIWQLGWPTLWRDRWRWLARRWVFALAGFAAGFLVILSWHFDDLEALWESEAQIQDLRQKHHAWIHPTPTKPPPGTAASSDLPKGPPPVLVDWPAPGEQAALWPQLERLMTHHGLRWLSLQLEPPQHVGGWPSQTVALRVHGRFEDWVQVWTAMNGSGPFWGMERLRITPQASGVEVDAVMRLWLSPGGARTTSVQGQRLAMRILDEAPIAPPEGRRATVFVQHVAASANSPDWAAVSREAAALPALAGAEIGGHTRVPDSRPSNPPEVALSSDPAQWPLEQIRLAGVWQSDQDVQLILQAGPYWVPARVGQRMGPHGHVVHGIHAEEVHLRAAQGPMWVIGLEKAKP